MSEAGASLYGATVEKTSGKWFAMGIAGQAKDTTLSGKEWQKRGERV